jgi:hypothetical protein
MFMIEFSELTARLARALASWVSSVATLEATVASATVAVPAAASSDSEVALLVTPLSESMAWPRRFWNELPAVPGVGDAAGADAAPAAIAAEIDGIGAIGGITITP